MDTTTSTSITETPAQPPTNPAQPLTSHARDRARGPAPSSAPGRAPGHAPNPSSTTPPLRGHDPVDAPDGVRFPRGIDHLELGRRGEQLAAQHLASLGMEILDRNVRLRRGEIDLVAMDGATLVIVEVKTRRSLVAGVPQAAVTAQKVRRLRTLTGLFLDEHSPRHRDVRIDVVAVLVRPDGTAQIEHLAGVGA